MDGTQFAITIGIWTKPKSFVVSLVSLVQLLWGQILIMGQEKALFSITTQIVKGQKPLLKIVLYLGQRAFGPLLVVKVTTEKSASIAIKLSKSDGKASPTI